MHPCIFCTQHSHRSAHRTIHLHRNRMALIKQGRECAAFGGFDARASRGRLPGSSRPSHQTEGGSGASWPRWTSSKTQASGPGARLGAHGQSPRFALETRARDQRPVPLLAASPAACLTDAPDVPLHAILAVVSQKSLPAESLGLLVSGGVNKEMRR